jgi:hypothetical protein
VAPSAAKAPMSSVTTAAAPTPPLRRMEIKH